MTKSYAPQLLIFSGLAGCAMLGDTYSHIEEHTSENAKPKAKSAASASWAAAILSLFAA